MERYGVDIQMSQNTAVLSAQQKKQDTDLQREIRRHQNTLYVLGIGVIVFGLWTFARAFLATVVEPVDESLFADSGVDEDFGVFVIYVLLFVTYGIDILIRLWVGIKAIRAGKGTVKKKLRLRGLWLLCFLGFVVIALEAYSVYLSILEQDIASLTNLFIAMLVDITILFVLFQLKYAEIKLRKLLEMSLSG